MLRHVGINLSALKFREAVCLYSTLKEDVSTVYYIYYSFPGLHSSCEELPGMPGKNPTSGSDWRWWWQWDQTSQQESPHPLPHPWCSGLTQGGNGIRFQEYCTVLISYHNSQYE